MTPTEPGERTGQADEVGPALCPRCPRPGRCHSADLSRAGDPGTGYSPHMSQQGQGRPRAAAVNKRPPFLRRSPSSVPCADGAQAGEATGAGARAVCVFCLFSWARCREEHAGCSRRVSGQVSDALGGHGPRVACDLGPWPPRLEGQLLPASFSVTCRGRRACRPARRPARLHPAPPTAPENPVPAPCASTGSKAAVRLLDPEQSARGHV